MIRTQHKLTLKRIACGSLAVLLLLSLAACGKDKEKPQEEEPPQVDAEATNPTFDLEAVVEGAKDEEEAARRVAEAFITNAFSDYVSDDDYMSGFSLSEGLENFLEVRRSIRLTEFSSDVSLAGVAINNWHHYDEDNHKHRFYFATTEIAEPHNETLADHLGNVAREVDYVIEVVAEDDSYTITRAIANDYSGVAIFPELRPTETTLGGVMNFDLAKIDKLVYSKNARQDLKAELLKGKDVGLDEAIVYEENRIQKRNEACAEYLQTLRLDELNQEAVDRFISLKREIPLLSPAERIEAAAYLPGDMYRSMHARRWKDIPINSDYKLEARSDGSLTLVKIETETEDETDEAETSSASTDKEKTTKSTTKSKKS